MNIIFYILFALIFTSGSSVKSMNTTTPDERSEHIVENNIITTCSSNDMIEILNNKFKLIKNHMVLIDEIIGFKEIFDLGCKGLYYFILQKGITHHQAVALFEDNNIPLSSDILTRKFYVASEEQHLYTTPPLQVFNFEDNDTPPLENRSTPIRENQAIVLEQREALGERDPISNRDIPQPLPQTISLPEQEIEISDNDEITNIGIYEATQSDDRVDDIGAHTENQIIELINQEIATAQEEEAHGNSTTETDGHSPQVTYTNTRTSQRINKQKKAPQEKIWQCEWHRCPYKNAEHKAFIDHVNTHKNKENVCRWKSCNNKKFLNDQQFNRHILTHSKEKKYRCETCNVSFARTDLLNAHKKTLAHKKNSVSQPKFPCMWQDCNHEQKADLKSAKDLYIHVVEDHAQPGINKQDKTCRFGECNKKFKRPVELLNHLRGETDYKEFTCRHCGNYYVSEYNKNKHEKSHTQQKKTFTCTIGTCTRTFGRETDLKRHKRDIHKLTIPDGRKTKNKK